MKKIKLNKKEQETLNKYIKEINKKGYSSDTEQQLIDYKIAEIYLKRITNNLKETKNKLEQSLEKIKKLERK